jgi:hypothetical protein
MAAVVVLATAGGCVERRMTIRSNPPGALVYVDDYEIGITPVSTSFIYYGQRRIRLVKDGYETLTLIQPIPPPWYEIVGIDFLSENLVPGKIHDERVFEYNLQPQIMVPPEQLRQRAEALRRGVQASSTGPSQPIPAVRINPPGTYP